jgi:uncharacterized membrane protein YdbT with pleckstrin-like domain
MSVQLMPGERRILLTRQHWSVVVPRLAIALLLLAAIIVGLVLIPGSVPGFGDRTVRMIIGIIVGVVVLSWCLMQYLRYRLRTYLLTDRRMVIESGVFSRTSESISLDRIQNTVINRPLGDRLIGAGDIEIESAGRDGTELLHRIPRAEHFYATLMQAMETMRTGGGGTAPQRPPL